MSVEHVRFALDQATNVSGSELLVLVALAEWADPNGKCWPSHDSIAARARVSRRQAIRLVQSLTEKGWIRQVARRQYSNEYYVRCDIAVADVTLNSDVTSSVSDVTFPASDVTSSATRCDIAMSPEPPIEPPIRTTSKNHQSGERAKRATQISDVFEPSPDQVFWAVNIAGLRDDAEVWAETEKFMDYHRAKGSTMKDWAAAWRNWMRNSVTYRKPSNGNGRASPVKLTAFERSMQEADKLERMMNGTYEPDSDTDNVYETTGVVR